MIYDKKMHPAETGLNFFLAGLAVGIVALTLVYGKSGATKIQEAQELADCRLQKKAQGN